MDNVWEITVLPQPKAPGMAVVPPRTQLGEEEEEEEITKEMIRRMRDIRVMDEGGDVRVGQEEEKKLTGRGHPALAVLSVVGGWLPASQSQASTDELATPSYTNIHVHTCNW